MIKSAVIATHLLALPVSRSLPLALLLTTGTFLPRLSLPRSCWPGDEHKQSQEKKQNSSSIIGWLVACTEEFNDSAAGTQYKAFKLTPWISIWFGVTPLCISSSWKSNKFNNYWVSLEIRHTWSWSDYSSVFELKIIYYRVNFSPLTVGPLSLSLGDVSENLKRDI